ncbi:sulfate adenylyltransferase subunit CysD [Adhaeribacter soli]|uniref:Sulfate adenylyltransferase subunit 2 n=1 Tax=Adhaeribacter soli TaxID=2607655 RepID=A0A5N1IL50_9BACT|nr:sulfate adenylyltransferase subunit CysD [Adhaeribacter soli]KAA9327412.1 sulfate adenylyltransferase subunit CysD [Adhaeribacter soli]
MPAANNYLTYLESEAIFVIREAVAQCAKPVLLFSGGKDSLVLVHLARKAFWPALPPFPLLHIDTGHNFPETITFRDKLVQKTGMELIVREVEDSIRNGRVEEEKSLNPSRNRQQSVTLLDAIAEFGFDAAFGGARRDEEKARAKERFFSHRDASGKWNPHNQRPELWNLFNGLHLPGEHFRIFPLSNWTELDVWRYIQQENLEVPDLYFAHNRKVVNRQGSLLAHTEFINILPGEIPEEKQVRFRTVGDATCTGAVESRAETIAEIIAEISVSETTERNTRADDLRSETAMEDRKLEGYF